MTSCLVLFINLKEKGKTFVEGMTAAVVTQVLAGSKMFHNNKWKKHSIIIENFSTQKCILSTILVISHSFV